MSIYIPYQGWNINIFYQGLDIYLINYQGLNIFIIPFLIFPYIKVNC